jgi:hypothetical protein
MPAQRPQPPARPRRPSYAERVADRRLDLALVEQARLGDAYGRAVGTSAEQSSYERLQAASIEVSRCDHLTRAAAAHNDEPSAPSSQARRTR